MTLMGYNVTIGWTIPGSEPAMALADENTISVCYLNSQTLSK